MDQNLINLTGVIGANVTLTQSWYAGTIGIIGGAIFGALLTGVSGIIRDSENAKRKKRDDQIQAHSNLLGCKFSFMQYLHSYFLSNISARSSQPYAKITAVALIDFIPAKERLERNEPEDAHQYINEKFASKYENSVDLEEALRYKERSEKLQLQIGDIKERFWISVGHIKTSFDDTKIQVFIEEILKAEKTLKASENNITNTFRKLEGEFQTGLNQICIDKDIKIKYASNPNGNRDEFVDEMAKELNNKRDITTKDAEEKIKIFESKIDDLLNYLENILKNPHECRNCNLFCSSKICPLKPSSQEEARDGDNFGKSN